MGGGRREAGKIEGNDAKIQRSFSGVGGA